MRSVLGDYDAMTGSTKWEECVGTISMPSQSPSKFKSPAAAYWACPYPYKPAPPSLPSLASRTEISRLPSLFASSPRIFFILSMSAPRESPPASGSVRRRSSDSTTRHDSAASEATTVSPATNNPPTNNIWDSAWATINQAPPPTLTDVLGAYAQKGENDREMLLRILQAKSAEDERIASVASLHRTILELQAASVNVQNNARALATAGYATPSITPPMHSPPLPHPSHHQHPSQRHSRHPSMSGITSTYGHGGSPPSHHEPYPNGSSSSASYPSLPPIATMNGYGEPSRKRARAASPTPAPNGGSRRGSPEYPLSPYSMDSSSRIHRSPPRHSNGYSSTAPPPPQWSGHPPSGHGRVSVTSLLGTASEDDGDVRYRRLSAERSSR
ncbi:hypothetical protein FRB94_009010 [Tulasnella sp. JGI-2019a]|nr:hypothetical protein FRB94_009010 [Tulasnella sp. JGI-2019a]